MPENPRQPRRVHSDEFKRSAVELVTKKGYTEAKGDTHKMIALVEAHASNCLMQCRSNNCNEI